MTKRRCLFLFFIIFSLSPARADRDVNDVLIEGDSTLMGMRIESTHFAEDAFLIETTGARFEYVKGCLKLYQGLDPVNRRLLSEIEFDNDPNFTMVQSTQDHVLFWSKDLNIGIYGDSTLIVSPKKKQTLTCTGYFKPDYEGRYKGELLLIDDAGGMEIYPQRYETGYKIRKIELGKTDWIADYALDAGERVMIAAFPGRPFDWEKSFKCNIVTTCGSMGFGRDNPYGQMPSDRTIRRWAINFHIITMFFSGLYENATINGVENPAGPYIIANKPEFKRFLSTAHEVGLKVIVYSSMYEYAKNSSDFNVFFNQIDEIRKEFGIDGVYIDGLTFGKEDNKIANWKVIRRFREVFGAEGKIELHATHLGQPTATSPNIETYCDAVLDGEGIEFNSIDDPYIKYHVRKYGISNTVALWKTGKHPKSITDKQITDALIKMNGRKDWGGFVVTATPPPDWPPHNGKYVWANIMQDDYLYYLKMLKISEKNHKEGSTGLNK